MKYGKTHCPYCRRQYASVINWQQYGPGEGKHLCWSSPGFNCAYAGDADELLIKALEQADALAGALERCVTELVILGNLFQACDNLTYCEQDNDNSGYNEKYLPQVVNCIGAYVAGGRNGDDIAEQVAIAALDAYRKEQNDGG